MCVGVSVSESVCVVVEGEGGRREEVRCFHVVSRRLVSIPAGVAILG